jgi:hypothetical protein
LIFSTQEVMNRETLEGRNSAIHRCKNFFESAEEKFCSAEFSPTVKQYDELLPQLGDFYNIEQTSYPMDALKVKEIFDQSKNEVMGCIDKWERSGNGSGQSNHDAENWGTYDLTMADTSMGDNRFNFIPNGKWHLFYFWSRLDEEDLLQFTLCKLPDFMKANSSSFTTVATRNSQEGTTVKNNELATTISEVGTGIMSYANANWERLIVDWEEAIFKLEDQIRDCTNSDRIGMYEKRKLMYEKKVENARKQKRP